MVFQLYQPFSDTLLRNLTNPRLQDIQQAISSIPWDDITFAILSKSAQDFLECSGSSRPDDGWAVRAVREGSEFLGNRPPASLDDILFLLTSYLNRDDQWEAWIDWTRPTKGHVIGLPGPMHWPADRDLFERFPDPRNRDILYYLTSGCSLLYAHSDLTEILAEEAKPLSPGWKSYCPSTPDFAYEFFYTLDGVIFALVVGMSIALRLPDEDSKNPTPGLCPADDLGRCWFMFESTAEGLPLKARLRSAFESAQSSPNL